MNGVLKYCPIDKFETAYSEFNIEYQEVTDSK